MISFESHYFRFNTRLIYIVLVLILVKSNLVFSYTLKEYAKKPFGNVLFIRHAMAPGYGDPPNFVINDCSTQRNLNNDGRTQAVKIGRIIKREGIKFLKIYSSQWCRCLETARLIDLGKITIELGLNSFFQGFVSKEKTLKKLQEILKSLEDSNDLILMVTHQVTITAITGISVSSGGAVAFSTKFWESKEVKIIN
jgi:broad specificity phosphatase PhoE